ncbi:MAG: PHP domain-containing protein [Clostridiales Family XIII bacterium]|jgi:predicted metal-dependent phosphoesterase TrpH|nr:PHP domain-containing protein [Clostridiales Family XIII bacterium]
MSTVDLHLHTNRSDGQHPPAEVMRRAAAAGLRLVAVTDHDTTDGVHEAQQAAARLGIRCLPGIEISTKHAREQHILGYLIDIGHPKLVRMCAYFMALRKERCQHTLEYLAARGIVLTEGQIAEQATGGYIGRPQIAAAMVAAGHVPSIRDAFRYYLTGGDYRKVKRPKPTARESIDAIRSAGGIAVLAHPHSLRLSGKAFDDAVATLAHMGLGGLECHYADYGPELVAEYTRVAERYGLVVTGGSDYHGERVKPEVCIGTGTDSLFRFGDLDVEGKLRASSAAPA